MREGQVFLTYQAVAWQGNLKPVPRSARVGEHHLSLIAKPAKSSTMESITPMCDPYGRSAPLERSENNNLDTCLLEPAVASANIDESKSK